MSTRNHSLPRTAASACCIGCAAPYFKQLRLPAHSGEEPVLFRHGTSSAKSEPE